MELPDELCYEDVAWLCAQEARAKALQNDLLAAERLLRDRAYCRSHTDRHLRELSREARCSKAELQVLVGESIENHPSPRRCPLTSKEKRIGKKIRRRAERFLENL